MIRNSFSNAGSTPATRCPARRASALPCACAAAMLVLPWLAGCDKLPKASEIINPKEEKIEAVEKKPAPAPAPAPEMKPQPVAPPPPPKKRSPEEVLGEFNRTKTKDRSDNLLAEIGSMDDGQDQITKMLLQDSKVTDVGLKHLEKLDNVTEVNLSAVNFSPTGLAPVAKMKNVQTLVLTNTPALARQKSQDPAARSIDTELSDIKTMPRLRRLVLTNTKFSDKGIDEIAKMKDLEALSLQSTYFTDEQLMRLEGLTNLRELDISKTKVTDKCFASLMKFKDLEKLIIGGNNQMFGRGMLEARKRGGLSKLKHLSVAFTAWDNDGMLAVQGTPTLEYLDVGKTKVNDNNLEAVRKLKDLQHIYLHELDKLSPAGLKSLSGLKELRTIFLDKSRGINDASLANLKTLKKLERLVITETSCTEKGALALKKFLPEVSIELHRGGEPL